MNDKIIDSLNKMSQRYLPYLKNPEPSEIKANKKPIFFFINYCPLYLAKESL